MNEPTPAGETRSERTYLATAVPCNSHDNGLHGGRAPCEDIMPAFMGRGRCVNCIGDGTRLDLDSLREVEQGVASTADLGRPVWRSAIEDEGSGGVW
jgi:hypothetical protein